MTFVDDFLWLKVGLPYSPCRFYNNPFHQWIEQACSDTCPPYDNDYRLHDFIFTLWLLSSLTFNINKGRRSLFIIHIEHMFVLREVERTCLFHYTLPSLSWAVGFMRRFKKTRALWHMVTLVLFGLIDVEKIVEDSCFSLVHLWDASLGAKENLFVVDLWWSDQC